MQRYYEIPNPLSLDWLTENADETTLSSREMEIMLAEQIAAGKNFNIELGNFFAEKYPDTLKIAMKLAFRPEEPPHFQALLNLIKEKPEFSEFYEAYCAVKEILDTRIKDVEKTWQKVKGVRFEKAIMAVNILYLKFFLGHLGEGPKEEKILDFMDYFLEAANIYLTKAKEHWKPADSKLWNNEEKLFNKMYDYCTSLLDDGQLLEKIQNHIVAIIDLQMFKHKAYEPFVFDRTFKYNSKDRTSTHDDADDIFCQAKNQLTYTYYRAKNKNENLEFSEGETSMLMEYFGIKKQFLYQNETYNLPELIKDKERFYINYAYIHLINLLDFYEENPDMPFEDIILDFDDLPVEVFDFSNLAWDTESSSDNLRLISTDISDSKSQIDLSSRKMFHYGQSAVCIAFPYIKTNSGTDYFTLLKLLKKSGNENSIDETMLQLFKEFPSFSDAKITTGKEIDIAICKDKTLILIAAKSTYGILTFEEKLEYEKHLICCGHKLNKTLDALQANAELLAEITGSSDIKFEELRIETMIVSNSFEFDGRKFQGHRKLSLLELMVILRDDASNLIPPMYEPDNKPDVGHLKLYSTDQPSVEDFFTALNSNIWDKVLKCWEFSTLSK